jgi:DNA-binding MarR family transcriptional regulator
LSAKDAPRAEALGTKDMDKRALADPGTAQFQVSNYPFYLVNRLTSRYNSVIEAQLREVGLDIPTWRVLMVLAANNPRGVRDLADACVIPISTMTRIVQRMTAADLVRSTVSTADARITEVHLTALGQSKVVDARAATSPVYRQVIKNVSAKDFDKLINLLNLLYDNLSET